MHASELRADRDFRRRRAPAGDEGETEERDIQGFIPRHRSTFMKNLVKYGMCSNWEALMQRTVVLSKKTDAELQSACAVQQPSRSHCTDYMTYVLQEVVYANSPEAIELHMRNTPGANAQGLNDLIAQCR